MEKILTVPEELKDGESVYCTGNEYISVSEIGCDGTIRTVSHLRESTLSLIEYSGAALLSILLDGNTVPCGEHRYIHDFIPEFCFENGDISIVRQVYAPKGIRGFGVRCALRAKTAHSGSLGLVFRPDDCLRTVFKPLPLSAERRFGYDSWSDTVYTELVCGTGISALAIGAKDCRKSFEDGVLFLDREYSLYAGEELVVDFHISLGCELDGARLANVDMRRRSAALFTSTAEGLDKAHVPLPDSALEQRVNLNLAYCLNFSMGRTLDTDRLVLLTSRSARYYVSGAYWARDSMLWAFPAVLRADRRLAREALIVACTTYLKHGAEHALYINGVSLYPGFELDQLVAPVLALERDVRVTGDESILELPEIKNALLFTLDEISLRRDEDTGLFSTELSPSDDPCEHPYLTYDNYLCLAALRFMNGQLGGLDGVIETLESALRMHCVKDGVFLWACDGKGGGEMYDNPPGSLVLIPYYGGCAKDDPVWLNTVRLYFSKDNPWYTENGVLFGEGCEHAPAPWPMSLCNLLLSCGKDSRVFAALAAMEMDNGIACETVRPDSGKACTGAAFATFAGFYANAVIECYED